MVTPVTGEGLALLAYCQQRKQAAASTEETKEPAAKKEETSPAASPATAKPAMMDQAKGYAGKAIDQAAGISDRVKRYLATASPGALAAGGAGIGALGGLMMSNRKNKIRAALAALGGGALGVGGSILLSRFLQPKTAAGNYPNATVAPSYGRPSFSQEDLDLLSPDHQAWFASNPTWQQDPALSARVRSAINAERASRSKAMLDSFNSIGQAPAASSPAPQPAPAVTPGVPGVSQGGQAARKTLYQQGRDEYHASKQPERAANMTALLKRTRDGQNTSLGSWFSPQAWTDRFSGNTAMALRHLHSPQHAGKSLEQAGADMANQYRDRYYNRSFLNPFQLANQGGVFKRGSVDQIRLTPALLATEPGKGIERGLRREKIATTAQSLLDDTGAFNRLVDLLHKKEYTEKWLPQARRSGAITGGVGGGGMGALLLGAIGKGPGAVLGAGIGGIGGSIGGSRLGKRLLDMWNQRQGRSVIARNLTGELEDQLIKDLKQESIRSAVDRTSMPPKTGSWTDALSVPAGKGIEWGLRRAKIAELASELKKKTV